MKSINILLIQICFLLYMTSFCNSRSFKDLALLSALLDYDFFFLGILAERRQLNWRRLLLLKSYYSVNVFNTKKRPKLGQNITNVGFHDKPLIFFLWHGFHWLLCEFCILLLNWLIQGQDSSDTNLFNSVEMSNVCGFILDPL